MITSRSLSLKAPLATAFLLAAVTSANAQQATWWWWGADAAHTAPVSAANPLPVTVAGGSGMNTSASNAVLPTARTNLLPTPTNGLCLTGNGSDWVTGACGSGNYSTITLGSTALPNGATVTTIAGLTLTSPAFGTSFSASGAGSGSFGGAASLGTITQTDGTAYSLLMRNTTFSATKGVGFTVGNDGHLEIDVGDGTNLNALVIPTRSSGGFVEADFPTVAGTLLTDGNLGTGVLTFLGTASSANLRAALSDETGTGLAYFQGGDLGTPSAGVMTNATGTAASLTAGHVTTNANLTGPVTSVGNATAIANSAITNVMLAGSITAANLVGTDIATVGTLTAGATGAGFTIALGTSMVSGILAGANGGTANGFFAVSGPASTLKTFTFPNSSATVLTSNAAVTVAQGGTGAATFTAHGVMLGEGTSALVPTAAMTDGQLLVGQTSADPLPKTVSADATLAASGALSLASNNTARSNLGINVNGALKVTTAGAASQAACADLSNGATGCSTATGTSGATIPLLNGTNTFSGVQTFGQVIAAVSSQSGTTYTLAASDCGSTIRFTSNSAVAVTAPNSLAIGCQIIIEQEGTAQVTVSAGAGATVNAAHSYTKTFGQYAMIGVRVVANAGGAAAIYNLNGDGA